jgi:hypothetical protein
MRRWKLLAVLAVLPVPVAFGVSVLWPRPERITPENFDRIRKGMTLAEVEAILGPPGDYRTAKTESDDSAPIEHWRVFAEPGTHTNTWADWWTDTRFASVSFDESGRTIRGSYTPSRIPNDTLGKNYSDMPSVCGGSGSRRREVGEPHDICTRARGHCQVRRFGTQHFPKGYCIRKEKRQRVSDRGLRSR